MEKYMADEFDIDLQEEGQESKVEKRIKDLSEKVKLTAQERDELNKAKETWEKEKKDLEKDRDFFKGFSTIATKYQSAPEFQDKIREKVMSGYDVEDATVAVLARENKLGTPTEAPQPKESPAGGSATSTIKGSENKPLGEMTQAEKLGALQQLENESGGLSKFFRA